MTENFLKLEKKKGGYLVTSYKKIQANLELDIFWMIILLSGVTKIFSVTPDTRLIIWNMSSSS